MQTMMACSNSFFMRLAIWRLFCVALMDVYGMG